MKRKDLRIVLSLIGLYIIADGAGSIYIYMNQPWWPDHTVRLIRIIIGAVIVMIGEVVEIKYRRNK